MTYKLVKLEVYTKDSVLQELLVMVGTGKVEETNKAAAQAAAWNLTDKMSWQKLAAKEIERVGGVPNDPYFTQADLIIARQLVARAQAQARERDNNKDGETSPRPKNRVPESKR